MLINFKNPSNYFQILIIRLDCVWQVHFRVGLTAPLGLVKKVKFLFPNLQNSSKGIVQMVEMIALEV